MVITENDAKEIIRKYYGLSDNEEIQIASDAHAVRLLREKKTGTDHPCGGSYETQSERFGR